MFGTYQVDVRRFGFPSSSYADVHVEAQVVTRLDPVLTPFPDPGSISGTVTLEGVPVEGLDVCAYRQEDLFSEVYCPFVSVATDHDGRYQMTGLPAGEYWVRFDGDLSNYDTEWFDDAQTDLDATTITITDGDVFTGIDADLVNPFPDRALPDELVNALDLPSSSLVSATTDAHPDSLALGAAPMGSLPTSGSSYLIMSTGRAGEVLGGTPSETLSTDLEPSPHGVILAGGDVYPGDLTQVTLRTRPPADAACLAFDLQFLSETRTRSTATSSPPSSIAPTSGRAASSRSPPRTTSPSTIWGTSSRSGLRASDRSPGRGWTAGLGRCGPRPRSSSMRVAI